MAFWSRERVTLVVEQEAVRLMAVAGDRVTRWGSAPLPRGTLDAEGGVAQPAVLAQVLERLWATQSAPKEHLFLAVPGHHVASTVTSVSGFDTSNRRLMSERARAALARGASGPDAYVAWQEIGTSVQPGLFVVAAPVALVDGYLQAIERAGLGVVTVDVKPLALVRGIGLRHCVIVDGERSLGTIILVAEALPRRVRFQRLALPLLASPEEKIMRLGELLYETIRQYNNEEAQGEVLHPAVPVFLTGSLADHSFLQDIAREVLGHPIGHVKPPIALPPEMPLSQFLANIGLALKQ
ncbi:MAG: hypothetical protein ACRDIB_09680 [Ardenticatenaceae bacterium]